VALSTDQLPALESEQLRERIDAALAWFQKNSVWPMPMGLACCGIELMQTGASRFDVDRFGMIPHESNPPLRRARRLAFWIRRHVPAYGARRDLNPNLQQELVGDPFLSPCRIV